MLNLTSCLHLGNFCHLQSDLTVILLLIVVLPLPLTLPLTATQNIQHTDTHALHHRRHPSTRHAVPSERDRCPTLPLFFPASFKEDPSFPS
jgi:hypothetical protein